jgi:hypothetical protein
MGRTYCGIAFSDGAGVGFGSFQAEMDEHTYTYTGEFADGKAHGLGVAFREKEDPPIRESGQQKPSRTYDRDAGLWAQGRQAIGRSEYYHEWDSVHWGMDNETKCYWNYLGTLIVTEDTRSGQTLSTTYDDDGHKELIDALKEIGVRASRHAASPRQSRHHVPLHRFRNGRASPLMLLLRSRCHPLRATPCVAHLRAHVRMFFSSCMCACVCYKRRCEMYQMEH